MTQVTLASCSMFHTQSLGDSGMTESVARWSYNQLAKKKVHQLIKVIFRLTSVSGNASLAIVQKWTSLTWTKAVWFKLALISWAMVWNKLVFRN